MKTGESSFERERRSPNMRGLRVQMMASDHPYAERVGTVIAQVTCHFCAQVKRNPDCGYDDLLVELDDGTRTRVYEPEAMEV